VAAKGGGSENKSKMQMLNPSDSVVDWVLKTVPTMGAGWCPPGMLGIGIGGTAEKAMLLAKESLMQDIDMFELKQRGPQNRFEELRIELCDKINALGIGAQGLGGLTTVLDVKIATYPTHAASKPVAMIPNCAATRHAHFVLDGSGAAYLEPPSLDLWPDVKTVLAPSEIKTVFDVGANEGQSAREFLRHFPQARIFSFEPTPATFQKLTLFARAQPRLTPVNQALGEVPGRVIFNENAFHQTNSILPANPQSEEYLGPAVIDCERKIEVEMTTLDAFCRQESVAGIDLLKVDVQGFELFVLKGAQEFLSARKSGCIVLEVSFISLYENQATPQDLITLLANHQYDLMGFYDFAHSAQKRLMWCEMMFAPHR
jgi:FkbM family methyltransferase